MRFCTTTARASIRGLTLTVAARPDLHLRAGLRVHARAALAFGGHIYGATFFMATGFHGFHVIVGTIFLLVCLAPRLSTAQFTPEQHFGFEAAAWYWHFVDVVWLFLFFAIYIWGGWGAPIAHMIHDCRGRARCDVVYQIVGCGGQRSLKRARLARWEVSAGNGGTL